MLTNSDAPGGCWNARCKSTEGKPEPWALRDLSDAVEGAVDAVPSYGRYLHEQAEADAYLAWSYAAFIELLDHLPRPAPGSTPWMYAEDLLAAFVRLFDLDPDLPSTVELGRQLAPGIASGRTALDDTKKGKRRRRAYLGVDDALLAQAVLRQQGLERQLHLVA
jgi:hypothetical protein